MSSENPPPAPSAPAASGDGNVVAILSYLTIIGLIVALFMHNSNKTALGAYHLRQALGFVVVGFIAGIVLFILGLIPFVNIVVGLLSIPIGLAFLILWVLGLVSAIQGQQKPVPFLGASFQSWFATAFI